MIKEKMKQAYAMQTIASVAGDEIVMVLKDKNSNGLFMSLDIYESRELCKQMLRCISRARREEGYECDWTEDMFNEQFGS